MSTARALAVILSVAAFVYGVYLYFGPQEVQSAIFWLLISVSLDLSIGFASINDKS